MALVSIIIPCYNYGWLLPETLDSLLAQTYTNWECLIIDDGSTDNSRSVGETYASRDARFRYIHQSNKGMSAARNCGLDKARGEYIQLLDADDLLVPHKLERQVSFLEIHPTVDLLYGDVRFFRHGNLKELSKSSNMTDQDWMKGIEGQGEALINAIVETSLMVVHAPLTRATLIQRVGRFAEDLRSAEDWEFWVRCALAGGSFRYDASPDTWALVRVHATSTSQNAYRFQSFVIEVRERLAVQLRAKGLHQALAINARALQHSYAGLAAYQVTKGNVFKGIKSFIGLAYSSGKYDSYLRGLSYSLRERLFGKNK
jgi:glycosyltransferase involved in cell wall biosynthesis